MIESEEVKAVLAQVKNPKRAGDGYTARCPAHDDDRNSLSIGTGRDGKLLLSCHAGCTFSDILARLDLPRKQRSDPAQEIVYPYVDESGKLLYEVVRRLPKQFTQRRPNAEGGYEYKLGDVRRVIYRLPEIVEAIALDRTIFVPEGEKDVATLVALGLEATTTAGGAGAPWRPEYTEALRGADVVILPDNDEPGRMYAEKVSAALTGSAKSVRTLLLPGLKEKGDVTDWVNSGGTADQLQALLNESVATAEEPKHGPRIRLYDDEEIQSIPEPEWLVSGVFPGNSLVQLFGPSESMKTFAALDIACHVATGLEWHGKQVSRGSVVYVMAEGIHGAKHRVAAWKKFYQLTGKLGLYFVRHRIEVVAKGQDLLDLADAVRAQVPSLPALVVIDTLARNMKGNENATEDMNAFIDGCDELRRQTNATVMIVHHTGWTEAERARGNSSNHAALDTDVQVLRDGDRITLKCKKQKDSPHFTDLSFEALNVGSSLVLKPMDQMGGKLDGNRLVCLQALQLSDDGLSHGKWMSDAGLTNKKSSFNAARVWLESSGYVNKAAGRKYKVTEAGNLCLASLRPRSTGGPSIVQRGQSQLVHAAGGCITPALDLDQSDEESRLVTIGTGGNRAA